jgi:hypothetical protein
MIPLRAHMDKMEWRPDGIGVPLVIAQLGEVAGACGAAWQARQTG